MTAPRLYGRPGRLEHRLAAVVVGSQSLAVFFGALVAYGMAGERSTGWWLLGAGSGLAVLCIVAAALLRRPWGVTLGWVVQALTLASALVVPAMLVVAVIFLALWLVALVKGREGDDAAGTHAQ